MQWLSTHSTKELSDRHGGQWQGISGVGEKEVKQCEKRSTTIAGGFGVEDAQTIIRRNEIRGRPMAC